MSRRCDRCPLPAGATCRGWSIPHACRSARYRAYFLRRHEAGIPEDDPGDDTPPGGELFTNAASCPHIEPIPPEERSGCGCARRCTAGHGNRDNGGTDVLNCWDCPIAPRLQLP